MIGSSLMIQACAERTACPWPDAACSWCIPRVICYSKGQAKPELLVQIIFFLPGSVLPGLTLFTVSFRMSVPPIGTDFTACKELSHPFYLIGISQQSCDLIRTGVVHPFY